MHKKYLNNYALHCQACEYLKYFIMYSKTFDKTFASIISYTAECWSEFYLLNKHGIKHVAKLASFIYLHKYLKYKFTLFSTEYLEICLRN